MGALVAIFEADSFVYRATKGDHMSFIKPGCLRPVIIPKYSEVGLDIIHSNMRTAKLSRERYLELFQKT